MELLTPIDNPTELMQEAPKQPGESGAPQVLDDQPQQIATMIGRQNVSYEAIWEKAEDCHPMWQPVKCNSMRRAMLLASSATQHRTKTFEVRRRGRMVFVRLVPDAQQAAASGE
jgi:hypothetical protein